MNPDLNVPNLPWMVLLKHISFFSGPCCASCQLSIICTAAVWAQTGVEGAGKVVAARASQLGPVAQGLLVPVQGGCVSRLE
jgi:hypothetical protein